MEIALIIILSLNLVVQVYQILKPKSTKSVVTQQKRELSEEEKTKQENIKRSFDNLMNYDYSQALRRK